MGGFLVPVELINDAIRRVTEYYDIEVIGVYGSCARRFCKLEPGTLDINVLVDIGDRGDVAKWYSKEYGMTVILGVGYALDPWMAYPTTQVPMQTITTVLAHHTTCITESCNEIVSTLVSKLSDSDKRRMGEALIYAGYVNASKPTRLKSIQRALLDFIAYGVLWSEDPSYIPSIQGNDELEIIRRYMGDDMYRLAVEVIKAKLGLSTLDVARAGRYIAEWVESRYDLDSLRRSRDYVSSRYIDTSYALHGEWNAAWHIVYVTMRDLGFDIVLSVDPHDEDVVVFDLPPGTEAYVEQVRMSNGYRIDRIHATIEFSKYYKVDRPKPAFQPLSFVLATHSIPVTRLGQEAVYRARSMLDKTEVAAAYIYLSECFLEGHSDCPASVREKSFKARIASGAPPAKLSVPLYRVMADLLPRAIILIQGRWPEPGDVAKIIDPDMLELLIKQYSEPDMNELLRLYNYLYTMLHTALPVPFDEYYSMGREVLRAAGVS